jgi:DNA-binding Lrp family transcriptional regulator
MLSEKEKLDKLTHLGIELNQIRDLDILMERVLVDARIFVNADAGSIYIRDNETLLFTYIQNDTLQKRLPKGEKLIYSTFKHHESNAIRQFERGVAETPCIRASYHLSGRFDYMLHVSVKDLEDLGNLVKTEITTLPDFGKCETFLIFSEIQSNRSLTDITSES